MIRKTIICVVGVLAGASTGAYVDGFFEQENLVTNAYQQVASQFNSPAKSDESGEPMTAGSSSFIDEGNASVPETSTAAASSAVSKMSGSSSEISESAKVPNGNATPITDSETAKVANSEQRPSKSETKSQTASETPKSDSDKLVNSERKNVSVADADNPKEAAREESDTDLVDKTDKDDATEDQRAQEDKQSLEDAKSLALLDVRFAKETFKSTSGGELKYRKLSPRTAGDGEPLPLIVFLHGAGERGDDNLAQLKHGLSFLASREGMQEFPATIIAPQCPEEQRWTTTLAKRPAVGELEPTPSDTMRMTMELIDSIKLTDNIDPNRVYVTGLSMGGFGTLDLIARRPNEFAAAAPLCGGGDTSPEVINRIKDIPLWIIHGDKDPVVPVEYSREVVKALKDAGASPRYSELAGFKHNIWDAAYADTELYNWMFNQSKSGPLNVAKDKGNASTSAKTNLTDKRTKQRNADSSANQNPTDAAALRASLQGEWKVLAATQRGRRANAATLAKMRVAFNDDALLIRIGDRNEIAKFRLSADKNSPYPWIDMISQREGIKDSAGILAKQGNKLVVCWAVPGQPRPTTFDSKEGIKTLVLEEK